MKKLISCFLIVLFMLSTASMAAQKQSTKTDAFKAARSFINETILTNENEKSVTDRVLHDKGITSMEASYYMYFMLDADARNLVAAPGVDPAYVGMTVRQVIVKGKPIYEKAMKDAAKSAAENAKKTRGSIKNTVLTKENCEEILKNIKSYSDVTTAEAIYFDQYILKQNMDEEWDGIPVSYPGKTVAEAIVLGRKLLGGK